jgi:EAL and modified HD-GYP domain-containing signal transduction protein
MEQFEKMVMIAISSELGEGRPTELLVMALARARFCELAAPLAGLDGMEQYLIGMVSLMPAILGLPMARLLEMLPLRAAVREALLGRINAERALLTWVEEYERGNWERAIRFADRFRVNEERVARLYSEAIRWSEESLSQVRRRAAPGQLSSAELPEWADRARLTPFSLV